MLNAIVQCPYCYWTINLLDSVTHCTGGFIPSEVLPRHSWVDFVTLKMLLGNFFPNNSFYGFVAFSSVTLWWMARVCQGVPVLLVVSAILWGEWNINRGSFIILGNDGIKGKYIFADQIFSTILASIFLYEPVESFAELLPHHGVEMGKLSPEQCHFTCQAFQDFSNLSVWLFLSKSAFAVFSLSASSSLRMLTTCEKSFIVREWFRWDLCFTVE